MSAKLTASVPIDLVKIDEHFSKPDSGKGTAKVFGEFVIFGGVGLFLWFLFKKASKQDEINKQKEADQEREENRRQTELDLIKERSKAELAKIEARSKAELAKLKAESEANLAKIKAKSEAEINVATAKTELEMQKKEFSEVTIPLTKREHGLTSPHTSAAEPQHEHADEVGCDDPRRAAIKQLVSGEEVDDLEDITPEALAAAPDSNVMQDIIHEGLNLILAEKKSGKTILAVQLGVCLAKGEASELFTSSAKQSVVRQCVVYYDTEVGRSAMKRYHSEQLMEVLGRGFYLRQGSTEWYKLLDDIAAQVVDRQRESKHITFVLDCVYEYQYHNFEKLRKGLKKVCRNAHELYGCTITVIMVTHLKYKKNYDENVGSQNMQRAAVTWFTLKKRAGEEKGKVRDAEKELIKEVTLSWEGRYSEVGQITCIALGEKEGFPGNMHFELKPLDWKEVKKDKTLAQKVKERAHAVSELYKESNAQSKVDSKCLAYVKEHLLSEFSVEVHPETIRTWLNEKEQTDN